MQPGFTVGQNADGRLEIFGAEAIGPPGSNNSGTGSSGLGAWTIAQLTPGGSWGDWLKLGVSVNAALVVGNTADGRIQLFTTGRNGDIWSDWQTAASGTSWAGWTDFGGSGLALYPSLPNQSSH
jgi:hypothetical protein